MLVVTADLIDEVQNNRHRYPLVAGRATFVDFNLVGLEDLLWDRLADAVDKHWDDA